VSGVVTVSASASDNVAVGSVGFAVDGTTVATDLGAPYTASVDTTMLVNGLHTLTALATDTSGNTATSSVTVDVENVALGDTTPPVVSITSPVGGSTVSGVVTVSASASDNVAVGSVGFAVDGTTVATDLGAPYTASVDTTMLVNGLHTLTALATDTSGNTATSSVTINTVNPAPTSCPATPAGVTELSANLSLETGQSGWTGVYNANSVDTRVQPSGGSYDGGWALQISPKPGATGAAGVNNTGPAWVPGPPGLSTVAGKQYTGTAEVRAGVAGQQVTILLRETTPSGGGVSYASTTLTLPDAGWHPITSTYVAKSTGDTIKYTLYDTFTASTQHLLADCLSLQTPS